MQPAWCNRAQPRPGFFARVRALLSVSDDNVPLIVGVILTLFILSGGLALVLEAIAKGPQA